MIVRTCLSFLWKKYPLFVLYVDGMLVNKDLVLLENFSQLMEANVEEIIPHVCGLGNGWVELKS